MSSNVGFGIGFQSGGKVSMSHPIHLHLGSRQPNSRANARMTKSDFGRLSKPAMQSHLTNSL